MVIPAFCQLKNTRPLIEMHVFIEYLKQGQSPFSIYLSPKMDQKFVQSKLFKVVQGKNGRKIYEIDLILVAFVLRSCKLSEQTRINNPVVYEMFEYLKEKILPKRKYSKTGRMPTRMKAEEKIKFIMRCLENNLARIYNRPAAKLVNFNLQQQKMFFRRGDVRMHFHEEIPRIIQEKQKQNLQKIKEIESLIMNVITESKKNQKQAKKMLERDIKQRQLPWSIDMFADIKQFCKDLNHNFIENSNKNDHSLMNQKLIVQKYTKLDVIDQVQLEDTWIQECIVITTPKKVYQGDANDSKSTSSEQKLS